jgi:hypothetical protein
MSDLEARVVELEKFVASLRAVLTGGQHRTVSNGVPQQGGEVATEDLLNKPWADMEIRKDPPRTNQPTSVGKRMSQCTAEYLEDYASFHDWKARKGREEEPPRLNNKGKPWYESDELVAKVARGWAQRARERPAAKRAPKQAEMLAEDMGEDDIPF